MDSQEMALALTPLLKRLYTGHCALIDGDNPPVATRRPLTIEKIEQHCAGVVRYGGYPIAPGESTTRIGLLDLDSHKGETPWKTMVRTADGISMALNLEAGLETTAIRSSGGKGIHLFVLWDEPQDAYSVRAVLADALAACGLSSGTKGVSKGEVEVFPKQPSVPVDGWGNMFVLPFAGKSKALDPVTWQAMDKGKVDWLVSPSVPVKARPAAPARALVESASGAQLVSMLESIPNDSLDYALYFKIMCAVHHATQGSDEGLAIFETWADKHPENRPEENARIWAPLGRRQEGPMVTAGTLKVLAGEAGWLDMSIAASFEILGADGEPITEVEAASIEPDKARSVTIKRNKSTGEILPTKEAIVSFLRFSPDITKLALKYDEFLARMVRIDEEVGVKKLDDEDYFLIALRLEKNAGFKDIPMSVIRDAVRLVAKYQKYDSALAWAATLPVWDGVERIERFYPDYLGTEDSEYSRSLGLYQWTGMAGRLMDPGCQLDVTPIWIGAQGTLKTRTVRALAPHSDYFGSLDLGLKDAEFARKIRGKLILEIGELKGLNKRDRESVKDALTRTEEEWSEKFVEHATTYKRRCFQIATTNEDAVLDDPTGHRRFAPIETGICLRDKVEADRDQLWAEGLARWRSSGIVWQGLSKTAPAMAVKYEREDPWTEKVQKYLADNPLGTRGLRVVDLLEDVFLVQPKEQDKASVIRVASILRAIGLRKKRVMVDGVQSMRWYSHSRTTLLQP